MRTEDVVHHPVEGQVVIMAEPEPKLEDSMPRSINIFGSNNVIGQNVFIINTNADQQDLEQLIKALPPEFLDNFLKAIGSVLQTYHQNHRRN